MSITTSWNNYLAGTWGKYLPPIRPYTEEIDILRQYLVEYKETPPSLEILILGSTPELRDLVNEVGLTPTVVDYSEDNYTAMGTLKKIVGKEIFINSNWLSYNPVQQFDFILSEAAFNVLDSQSSKKLYAKCKDWLKPGGKLLAKNWVRISNRKGEAEDLISNFRCQPEHQFGFYSFACIPLMLCFYDFSVERITLKDFSNECRNLFEKGKIKQAEWDTIGIHEYENVDLQLYIPDVYEFINDISNHFYIEQIHDIKRAYSEYHPIFVLTRR